MRFFGCLAVSLIIFVTVPLWADEAAVQEDQGSLAATNDQNPIGTSVLEGRVVDDDGQPVADTLLELRVWEWNWPRPLRTVRSTADGRFRFTELDGRQYSLLTQVDGRVLALQYVRVDEQGQFEKTIFIADQAGDMKSVEVRHPNPIFAIGGNLHRQISESRS